MDTINKHNPLPSLGRIESTNPCGEVPLLPYESCTLGSINLAKITITKQIDWSKLKGLVWLGVRFLDNVIEVNKYILPEIEKTAKENRKIGLGVMGFADMLIQLGIPYNSEKAASTAKEIMKFISSESHKASGHLAKERGNFPNYIRSIYYNKYPMRNATCTTIAPTGTLSIIAGCSSGIEPIFAINYERNISGGSTIREINPYFEEYARKCNFYSKNLFDEIRHTGSAQNIKQIPETVRELFRTAAEIHPFQHLSIQSAFQKFTDNAVSKTINLPTNSSPRDIKNIFLKAFDLGCKGVTVYRYSSIKGQILRLEGFEDQCVPHKCYF
jgi:ribonucleoside-diphosphate reductase alpha chain